LTAQNKWGCKKLTGDDQMREAVIVSGARTAIGKFGGALKDIPAAELGSSVIREVLKKAGLKPAVSDAVSAAVPEKLKGLGLTEPEKKAPSWEDSLSPINIDEVIMGNVLQAGQGQNPGRQAMIYAGLPKETPAFTINKICGSGLKAIALGAQQIITGQADVIIAGGQENMSMVPFALKNARWGYRMEISGAGQVHDLMVFDGLYEIFYGYHMGTTAENIARMYGISRQEQDELGVLSHTRAMKAIKEGLFRDEIVPLTVGLGKNQSVFDTDERPMETSLEKMSAMKSAFAKDGTVTAGNSSGINDAAAAVLMMSADAAKKFSVQGIAKIKAFASGGLDPAYMGLGPVPAVKKTISMAGICVKDLDMMELNEAFASQAIGCYRELGVSSDMPNQLGSGISLGHPIGCTGARMMVSSIYEMKRRNHKNCLLSMCIGGGMGIAMLIERV
jgi:acetyl-CoA C-acetyltransferase